MKIKIITLILFTFSFFMVINAQTHLPCNSISNLNDKLNCVIKSYNQSKKRLDISYKKLINLLKSKSQRDSLKFKSKNLFVLNLLKNNQLNWIIIKNYNAQVHYSLSVGKLNAKIAFYLSKIKDNESQTKFLSNYLLKNSAVAK